MNKLDNKANLYCIDLVVIQKIIQRLREKKIKEIIISKNYSKSLI